MRSLPELSVRNPILVNLAMIAIIGGGVYSAMTMVREMFPESRPNQVMIMTPYPGASPSEVEKGITIKIEEQIKDVEGIEKVVSTIREGSSVIMAQLYNDVEDLDRVVNDIKNKVDAIPRTDFPEEAEETVVSRFEPTMPVISVSLYGDMTDEQLKTLGKRMRDDIIALPDITRVELSGTKRDEISVEVQPEQLIRYGLSFLDISEAIRRGNLDLPGGQVKTERANVAVRTLGEKDRGEDLEHLIVRGSAGGDVLRLADISEVVDGFEDLDLRSRIDGYPGVSVTVSKTADQDAILISQRVQALVAGKNRQPLETDWLTRLTGRASELQAIRDEAAATPYPQIGTLKVHSNLARFIEGRLDLLQRNGLWGMVFVFLSLLFFLNWRVAFWVMIGLLLAILGTLVVMQAAGVTLNLISMFGLIVVLGMLVDDAIIVGEHVYTKIENGAEPELAAIKGAEEVTSPVTCAILTTIVAFAPLLFIEGRMGDFMGVLPLIVIFALSISLVEALSILPSHLAESFLKAERRAARRQVARVAASGGWRQTLRDWQVAFLDKIIRRGYRACLERAVSYRYVTIAGAAALLIFCLGMIGAGKVPFIFLQEMDAETLIAAVELPVGSTLDRTDEVMSHVEKAVNDVPEMNTAFTIVGAQMDFSGTNAGASNAHVGQIVMELTPSEERERTSDKILNELRRETANTPGVNSLTFTGMHGGPGGAPIQYEITGENIDHLVAVTARLKEKLREYAGVFDIEDDFDAGQREVQVELLDSGRALGLTTEQLAMQVRAAFFGLEARKIQRDREDVKIMVRYPESRRQRIADPQHMRVATPSGVLVPISEVARIREGSGYATIRRKDQQRAVTVKAEVDQTVANAEDIIQEVNPFMDRMQRAYPGVRYELGGQSEEQAKSFGSLKRDALIALVLIYVVLAGLFRSYVQPAIVMVAIPFGLIGAVLGHYAMGYPFTVLSAIGLVALTGIVVNDSLILVEFINREVRDGVAIKTAVVHGGLARLRAIMLTTITTILGLAPLLTEKSFQARFLIPMGISIAAGLAFATVLTLIVVPCLYVVVEDVKVAAGAIRRAAWPEAVEPAASPEG